MGLRLMTVVACLRSMAACYELGLRKVSACLRSTTACSGLGSRTAATCLRSMIACPWAGVEDSSALQGWGQGWSSARGQLEPTAVDGAQRWRQMDVFGNFAKCWKRVRAA
jgi:hypothetical protein